ncbi:Transcriptional regulator, PadR family [Serinicoccus hydrothermalis]|uniref:Transcriptional regulator, PadR family n=1 Tax=Serinicoccus hydrothermalis TaxID=1758689 RepID=A0A1B1NET4_9MICO|nr:PadR family transcriptional regulator [Serinicoccus hydrothermalis]ANS79946.1 Transcriptional regulator, PadR family [Serinicoccus hydrothermalis]
MTSRQNFGGFGNMDDQIFGPNGLLGQVFGQPGGPFGPQGPGPGGRGRRGGPWGPQGFGPQGGPRRARRGDVRNAVLHLLQREPMNGYQLMQEIEQSSGGAWRPSSGAIYPALAQLEDEGLVSQTEVDGRRAYELTEAGRAAAQDLPPQGWAGGEEPDDPWAQDRQDREERRGPRGRGHRHGAHSGHGGRGERERDRRGSSGTLWKALGSVAMATQAVGQSGQDQLNQEAAELLDRTRRDLYRMLAEAEVARDEFEEDSRQGEDPEEIAEGEIVED